MDVRSTPFPADMKVVDALHAYLAENGFTLEGYDAKWTDASVLGIRIRVPNTPAHRIGIQRHDLHHVATGYGTDLAGEGEISAWEARRGLGDVGLYVGSIILSGMSAGFLVSPRRVFQAWRRGPGRASLFEPARKYEQLLEMTVGELRRSLDLPLEGLARGPQGLHSFAPARRGHAPA